MHGKGTFYSNNAEEGERYKYEGEFLKGYMSGYGILTGEDGSRYEGNFLNDVPHGFGKFYETDGSLLFEGQFANGEPITGKEESPSSRQRNEYSAKKA